MPSACRLGTSQEGRWSSAATGGSVALATLAPTCTRSASVTAGRRDVLGGATDTMHPRYHFPARPLGAAQKGLNVRLKPFPYGTGASCEFHATNEAPRGFLRFASG